MTKIELHVKYTLDFHSMFSAGRASSKIYLELTQVPVARVYPRRSDFKAGSSFSIHCTFSAGIPQPTVRFKKDGQYIEVCCNFSFYTFSI